MKNAIKTFRIIVFAVMVVGFSTAVYAADQKSITITGIPSNYRGKTGMLALTPSPNSQNYIAYSLVTITGISATFPLSDWTTDNPWGGNGNYAFVLLIGDTAQAIANKQYLYSAQTAATVNVSQVTTAVQWSQFLFLAQQSAPQDTRQKSITITGIPSNYRGKTGMLALTPSPNSQNYIAYSLVTITGISATFPLSDWTTDNPWGGNGNYAFVLLIGDTAQAIANKQYLYSAQTAATVNVSQVTTAVQWSQFLFLAQQSAPQDTRQKSITITGIPGNYRGKVGMLALAPSPNSQNYIAYSLVTITGSSATFPLSDWTTDNPWGGNGNYAFVILIGDTAQAIASKQYLYAGQTAATVNVSQVTTAVQWSQFVFLTQ